MNNQRGRGGLGGFNRGGGRGGRGGSNGSAGTERKRENILDLKLYQDKQIRVKFQGGREGTLKGYDPLMNIVLDEAEEYLQDASPSDPVQTRRLGLVVARGPSLILISPVEGSEEIDNPFVHADE